MARTVLLADDSVTAQNMGRRILIDAGYEVVTVNNGSAALKRIHESRPDLIVLDVYMPGYGGLEVCQRLKESAETAKIPILLTVGKMEPFKAEEARRARADGHIIKPFDASELLAALTKLEDRIVPQAETSRGRKPKLDKKIKSGRSAFDPTMGYDDTHSDKIAYLAEVKQRRSNGEHVAETTEVEAEVASVQHASAEETRTPVYEEHKMPRPMSVYAAEALRELPVVAEPSPVAETAETNHHEELTQTAGPEEESNAAAQNAGPVENAVEHAADETKVVSGEDARDGEQISASVQTEAVSAESDSTWDSDELGSVSTVIESAAGESEPDQAPAESNTSSATVVETVVKPEESVVSSEIGEPSQSVVAKSRWVAENVAVSAEEAALELDREMQETQALAEIDNTPVENREGVGATVKEAQQECEADSVSASAQAETPPMPDSSETNGATFAAAAAASTSPSGTAAVSGSASDPEVPVASEAAAAWENWQHIRDSVMGSQTAVQLSESVVEAVHSSAAEKQSESAQSNETALPAQNTQAPTDDSENAALSSIVDSVLAELKPKLMAEISKKLKK